MGILVCNECNEILESTSRFVSGEDVDKERYGVHVIQRKNWGRLLISDFGYLICKPHYSKLADFFRLDPKQMKENIFLAIESEQGYQGINAPKYARNYQFIDFETAKEFIPTTIKHFKAGLEKITFINLKELQKKHSDFIKEINGK